MNGSMSLSWPTAGRLFAAVTACVAAGSAPAPTSGSPARPALEGQDRPGVRQDAPERGHDFYFTRAVYSGMRGFRGRGAWATDFPKADRQFLFVLGRLLEVLDVYESENPVRLDDPELRRYPFLYALEVGYMSLTEAEVAGLRGYLEAGGFLFVDDFWGTREWENFEREIARVLPDRRIVELPPQHPIFHQFYDIEEILQVPNVGNGVRGGPTFERDGYVPHVRGILDDDGELMVLINWNTDLGDAWEWSENPYYPIEFSNFAYEMAVNAIIYAYSH
ncbi:MAG: DUF4159 domain-containing protein [Gemmatimonadota bacterium]